MTTQELKTETARLAAEVSLLYCSSYDIKILPRARDEIHAAMQALDNAYRDLEATPPTHGRLGQHDVRD